MNQGGGEVRNGEFEGITENGIGTVGVVWVGVLLAGALGVGVGVESVGNVVELR